MSKSQRKTKIFGNAHSSEKDDKRINNRMFRRKEHIINERIKQELYTSEFLWLTERDEDIIETTYPLKMNEVRNVWSMDKDGKSYFSNASDKMMRK